MRATVILIAAGMALLGCDAQAAVVGKAIIGCKTPGDAIKVAGLQAPKDAAALEKLSGPMVASGACMTLMKGVSVDIDEKKPPLSCVRLTGDLNCYWVPSVIVDEHPGQKGGAPGSGGHGNHRH